MLTNKLTILKDNPIIWNIDKIISKDFITLDVEPSPTKLLFNIILDSYINPHLNHPIVHNVNNILLFNLYR